MIYRSFVWLGKKEAVFAGNLPSMAAPLAMASERMIAVNARKLFVWLV